MPKTLIAGATLACIAGVALFMVGPAAFEGWWGKVTASAGLILFVVGFFAFVAARLTQD